MSTEQNNQNGSNPFLEQNQYRRDPLTEILKSYEQPIQIMLEMGNTITAISKSNSTLHDLVKDSPQLVKSCEHIDISLNKLLMSVQKLDSPLVAAQAEREKIESITSDIKGIVLTNSELARSIQTAVVSHCGSTDRIHKNVETQLDRLRTSTDNLSTLTPDFAALKESYDSLDKRLFRFMAIGAAVHSFMLAAFGLLQYLFHSGAIKN